ncbi:MAG: hypothetical protein ACK5D5_12905 [Bacteroidota bacterium]
MIKTQTKMNKTIKSIVVLSLALFAFIACERQAAPTPQLSINNTSNTVTCGTPQVQNLMAGQNIIAGTISISNDANNVYVTYTTTGGWEIQKTHLYVGACNAIPTNNGGNPIIGQFPNQTTHNPRVTSFTYTISLANLSSCYCVAAHAEVVKVDGSGNITQTETGWGQGNPFGGNSWAMIMSYCTQSCSNPCVINNGDFRTQTQGGWGSTPNGNNPGAYLHANFAAAFPGGLTVGCGNTISLTSAQAVTDFLPQGGTPVALTQSYTNPTTSISVLAGQVTALSLSVGFDAYDSNFGASNTNLGSMVIATGTFQGWTVNQLIAEGNKVLGGCTSNYTVSQLNAAIDAVNNNFVDGTMVGTFITCP